MPDINFRGLKSLRGDGRARFIIGVGTAILGHPCSLCKRLREHGFQVIFKASTSEVLLQTPADWL